MLDVAIALTSAHPRTAVHAISRYALLPREHHWPRAEAAVSTTPVTREPAAALRLSALIRGIRASAAAHPGDWQDIVDALRPQIPSSGNSCLWRTGACSSATSPGTGEPPATSPPPPIPSCATCWTAAWPGQTRCGWDWTPTPAAPCATRPAGPPVTSSPGARCCAAAGTRRRRSPRSATRPPRSPATCSPDRPTPIPAAPPSQPGRSSAGHCAMAGGSVRPPMPCGSAVFARSRSTEFAKARLTVTSRRASSSSTAGRCSGRT
jgi:hypothetical protein